MGSAGGIVGKAINTVVQNCYNSGEINGEMYCYGAGGIAGVLQEGTQILSCYNIGKIHSFYIVGGITGWTYGDGNVVNNCYNKGDVTANSECAGGVVGQDESGDEIKNSYNVGKVIGSKDIGGVIGVHNGFLSNLFYINTSGPSYGCGINNTDNVLGTPGGSSMETIKQLTSSLNGTQTDTPWEDDIDDIINEGYPILSWQKEQNLDSEE